MILLEIKSIKKVKPTKWESNVLDALEVGQNYLRYSGDHPTNPEFGAVNLSTKIIDGSFEDISELLFIGEEAQNAKLLNHKKQFLGGHEIEVQFDSIFHHGLKYMVRNFIHRGGAIIGLTASEKESLNSVETQKDLLYLLASYIISSKKDVILNFAKTGFICTPNDLTDESASHFTGRPKHDESEISHKNQKPLFHLATMNLDDFPTDMSLKGRHNKLSFYLRIYDTENGWPEDKSEFKVFNYENQDTTSGPNDFEKAHNLDFKTILDLPGHGHSFLDAYKFSEDERARYETFRSVYMHLLLGKNIYTESNKFLGYPDSVQNCVAYEAERIFNKREYSDEIFKDAADWCLLLQVSPYAAKFDFFEEFGDGTIYYMIRKDDLNNGNFDNCQIVVQNT